LSWPVCWPWVSASAVLVPMMMTPTVAPMPTLPPMPAVTA